jgi:hypothetical protein
MPLLCAPSAAGRRTTTRDTRTLGLVVLGAGGTLAAASVVTIALLPASASASTSALWGGPPAKGPGL